MKPMTIWQRLDRAVMLLLALLLAAVGIAFWVESGRTGADQQRAELAALKDGICCHLVLLTDALRAGAVDSKNKAHEKHREDLEQELRAVFEQAELKYYQHPDLVTALKSL